MGVLMAVHRPKVSENIKEQLRVEAGGKCANPGCSNVRAHLHHIREWSVYKTHDEKHMIAVCHACHDAIHHGALRISDETVYSWKQARGMHHETTTHLYVEPGTPTKLLLGSISISAMDKAIIFTLSPAHTLSFEIADSDILLLDLQLGRLDGQELARVVKGYVRPAGDPHAAVSHVPGHIRVELPTGSGFVPEWFLDKMRLHEPDFAANGSIVALDLHVVGPGRVRVQGVWPLPDKVIAITESSLSFLRQHMAGPLTLRAHGEDTILVWNGPITQAMFGFE
jgi:hypothetical protein